MPLLPLLLGVAPTVASWILGDRTGLAVEKVTGIARDILGTDDPTGIEAAIARDPNVALQFKTALIQADRYGTSVGQALRVMAEEGREQRMMEAEKKAASLPPKLTVPLILFFLPVLFIVIISPALIKVFSSGVHF